MEKPKSNSILPGPFLGMPSFTHHRLLNDDYNHKVPLTLKFKERTSETNVGLKCKVDYRGATGFSLSDEAKFDTTIRGHAVHARVKGDQVKAQVDGGYTKRYGVFFNPSLILKGKRDFSVFKSVVGLSIHHPNFVYTGRVAMNQAQNVILTQRLTGEYKGIQLAETHFNNLTTGAHALKSLLAYRHKQIEYSLEAHREKRHSAESLLDLTRFFFTAVYHRSKDLQVALQYRENLQRNTWRLLLGASAKVNEDLSVKGKIDQHAKVSSTVTYKLSKNLIGNFYLMARTQASSKPLCEISKKTCLPFNIGTQFEWAN